MTENASFTLTRTFDAPRMLLWRAWTDPALTARWWHPEGIDILPDSVTVDLRDGGGYTYTMTDGTRHWPTAGTYLTINAPELLRFTWRNPEDGDDTSPVATVALREVDAARTEMTFTFERRAPAPADEHEDVLDGWRSAFDDMLTPLLVELTR